MFIFILQLSVLTSPGYLLSTSHAKKLVSSGKRAAESCRDKFLLIQAIWDTVHLTTQYCLPYRGGYSSRISGLTYLVDPLCIQNDSRLCILSHPKITMDKLSFLWIKIPSYIAGKSAPCGWEVTGPYNHCRELRVHLNITDTQIWWRNFLPCPVYRNSAQGVISSLHLFHPFSRRECHSWDSAKEALTLAA